jgi:hypothetical protein
MLVLVIIGPDTKFADNAAPRCRLTQRQRARAHQSVLTRKIVSTDRLACRRSAQVAFTTF